MSTVDWTALDWRKLYLPFSTSYERLPYAARAMGADVIRRCDREGRIVKVTDVTHVTSQASLASHVVTELAFHLRAHSAEEEWLKLALQKLLEDQYLVVEDGWLKIRNFVEAQKSSSAERMARKRQKDSAKRPSGSPVTSDARDVTGVTLRNVRHSDESDEEEKRREERDPPMVPQGDGGETVGLIAIAIRGYAAGIRAVTKVNWSFPDKPDERAAVTDLIWLHAPGMKGQQLEARMTAVAARYCEANKTRGQFEGGFRPTKCIEWLNAGGTRKADSGGHEESSAEDRLRRSSAKRQAEIAAEFDARNRIVAPIRPEASSGVHLAANSSGGHKESA